MATISEVVLARHGESEANVMQRLQDEDPNFVPPQAFLERHDSEMRLSSTGGGQADAAGLWLEENFPGGFDVYYSSYYIRAMETAAKFAIAENAGWFIDLHLGERDRGTDDLVSLQERLKNNPLALTMKDLSRWSYRPGGGETLGTDVLGRIDEWLSTIHRYADRRRKVGGVAVLAVTHGEAIQATMNRIEGVLPYDWQTQQKMKQGRLNNCDIVHYTHVDPETGKPSSEYWWRRVVCPWDKAKSWDNGAWAKIPVRRIYTSDDLSRVVERYPRLLDDNDQIK